MTLAEVLHTAAEQFDPSDSIDLVGMLIVASPGILAAILTGWVGIITVRGQKRGRARARRTDAMTDEIHAQTVNDHISKSNLRDDIDEIRDLVKDMSDRQIAYGHDIRGIRADVGELRGADRDANTAHTDLVRRLNAFIRREHPGADPL